MDVSKKVFLTREGLEAEGPITIVAFGDSVTHGALCGSINYETVYWNRLKKKINDMRSYMPVNVINAGIGGATATTSLNRIDSQVLKHEPDLVIVCFGLNDVNDPLELYLSSLEEIFRRCTTRCQVIFMTPNTLNTYVAEGTPEKFYDYAFVTADYQNSGRMDKYIYSAKALAEKMGVTVCDCYTMWKELSKTCDTTLLLANKINHPTEEMHELFAEALFNTIFSEVDFANGEDDTMYRQKG